MASTGPELGWEWRADRALTQRAALRVTKVRKEGGGLFGLLNAPSLARSLPDPMKVDAEVVAVHGDGPLEPGGALRFRIPKYELKEAGEGARVAIGLIGETVVCLTPVPDDVPDTDYDIWLPDAPCD